MNVCRISVEALFAPMTLSAQHTVREAAGKIGPMTVLLDPSLEPGRIVLEQDGTPVIQIIVATSEMPFRTTLPSR